MLKVHLKNFNDEGVPINDATVHSDVLSDSDGCGRANSKAIYKSLFDGLCRKTTTLTRTGLRIGWNCPSQS